MRRHTQMTLMTATNQLPTWTPDPAGEHGEVFTRRWVVELVLDAAGYRPEFDLGARTIIEPSCGHGAFLIPILERLAESCARFGRSLASTGEAIRGFDLLESNSEHARKVLTAQLLELGESMDVAETLTAQWITTSDFLLHDHDASAADFVVGNPPYIRLEDVPTEVSASYRATCETMRGRADIFVGFFERGLSLLAPEGRLAFICADRWMRNQYGTALRELVTQSYAVDSVIVMHDVDAFEDEVSAYPAITVLRNGSQGPAKVVETNAGFDEAASQRLVPWLLSGKSSKLEASSFDGAQVPTWFVDGGHWPSGPPQDLELLAELESRFPLLQDPDTGTRVGIGVATGCDEVYIVDSAPDVEGDRLLPLLTAADIETGEPLWSGRHLINPWQDGELVDLEAYPGLAAYLATHETRIRNRHVAKKQPRNWFRTIDRVTPGLREQAKLLLPDMKSAAHPVLDRGEYYPHHNLYYVVSERWDLEVLGGLLLSDVANLFVGSYCVKMRGGTYRFQAQYLRKIRVPELVGLSPAVASDLAVAFRSRDRRAATIAAAKAYGFKPSALQRS